MITKADMMTDLLAASPGFAGDWEAFRQEWAGEGDGPPLYLALSAFARHLVRLLEMKDKERLARVFRVVERLHVEGDAYVREAATVGLLESLQNTNLHDRTAPEQFCEFLQPESLRWWQRVESFWSGNPRALSEESGRDPAAG